VTVHVEVENRSAHAVDEPAAAAAVADTLRAEGVTAGEVGVVLVEPGEMAALNAAHRGKDEPTDVLSFPLDGLDALPDGLPRQLGDVVVCPERADADGTPIALLLVHGVLHLVGYDHEADYGDMLRRQNAIFEEVGPVAAVRPS
jgi:probable rRNA maturation factor